MARCGSGQASIEMTVAMIGALLLLFAAVKMFLWFSERLVTRQQRYEQSRPAAAGSEPGRGWDEPTERLDVLGEHR